MNLELINQLIKDSSNKEDISDGIFTLGEIHSDRASLYINLVELVVLVSSLKKSKYKLWYYPSEHKGYNHYGFELISDDENSEPIILGGIFPSLLTKKFVELGAEAITGPVSYPEISETLKLFSYKN